MPPQIDRDSNPEVVNDEYLTETDPNGELKINQLGELQGGRKFRVKTFKVPGKGNRLYCISTDVARMVGYRDSYFLFQKHINLYRFIVDENAKFKLINDGYLPVSFKTRHAYLITARSAFKEFGARIIVDGKQVDDDYYEQEALDKGAIRGALINPTLNGDDFRSNINNPLYQNSILETETSWVYDHALKCRQFNSSLLYDRQFLLKKKQRDIYTNTIFVPSITQPTKSKIEKIGNSTNLIFETRLSSNINTIKTGLSTVNPEIFNSLDDNLKNEILIQQRAERNL